MKNNTPFIGYGTGKTEDLSELGITKQYKPGESIVNKDVPVRSIPFVMQGSVKVMQPDEHHREMVLYYLRPGETCIMSFLAGMHNDTSRITAEAEEASEILFVPVNTFRDLIRNNPEWLNYLFGIYHRRFMELLDVVNAVAFRKMDQRLLEFLKKRTAVTGDPELNITHGQLAQEMGTAREVISRLLKQMETEGLVELGRNRILLCDSGH